MKCNFCRKKAKFLIHLSDMDFRDPYLHEYYYLCDNHCELIMGRIYKEYKKQFRKENKKVK